MTNIETSTAKREENGPAVNGFGFKNPLRSSEKKFNYFSYEPFQDLCVM